VAYTGSVPDTGAHRRDWMAVMACRTGDPDLFFDPARTYEARIECIVRCPVRRECLASIKQLERGSSRDRRDGVVAGLASNERWRLDPHVKRSTWEAAALALDGTEPCGTHNALLGHLWRGERVDPACWSAEVRRNRLDRVSAGSAVSKRRDRVVQICRDAPGDPGIAPVPSPVFKDS
jgi:hypothetical protein